MNGTFPLDIITVYFLYGLSFFSMGLAIQLEVGRSSKLEFAWALRPLAAFGLIHGSHEWLEMFLLIHGHLQPSFVTPELFGVLRVVLLAVSFLALVGFGTRLITGRERIRLRRGLLLTIGSIWVIGLLWLFFSQPAGEARLVDLDVYTRYSLAIPGAALTAWALALQQRKFKQAGMKGFGLDLIVAATAFGLYGGVGQLFAASSHVFPSSFINAQMFLEWFGFPVQLFRGMMALLAAIFVTRSLRAFEVETQIQIESLREAQLAEQRRIEAMRGELLRRTVRAQEDERHRIARELHDELGQTLTALGMGLRGISTSARYQPEQVAVQARHLETLVNSGLAGLQNLITGLHPPQLDDLGLGPALRWFAREVQSRYGLEVELVSVGDEQPLPPDVRTALYRIVQEALTNAVRHADASRAVVQLVFSEGRLMIKIEDNGRGFDASALLESKGPPRPSWGLLGMMERAAVAGGQCRIESQPGKGTRVIVELPITEAG